MLAYYQQIGDEEPFKWERMLCANNLEFDLLTTEWILMKARESKVYAQNLYAALCNNTFQKNNDKPWGASWRYSGGIIANMRQEGDYIDWYCSGIKFGIGKPGLIHNAELTPEQLHFIEKIAPYYVTEGEVTDEIRDDLEKLGWRICSEEAYPEEICPHPVEVEIDLNNNAL